VQLILLLLLSTKMVMFWQKSKAKELIHVSLVMLKIVLNLYYSDNHFSGIMSGAIMTKTFYNLCLVRGATVDAGQHDVITFMLFIGTH